MSEGGVEVKRLHTTTVIIADCENGSKYFGLRGIAADINADRKMGRYAGVAADRTPLTIR